MTYLQKGCSTGKHINPLGQTNFNDHYLSIPRIPSINPTQAIEDIGITIHEGEVHIDIFIFPSCQTWEVLRINEDTGIFNTPARFFGWFLEELFLRKNSASFSHCPRTLRTYDKVTIFIRRNNSRVLTFRLNTLEQVEGSIKLKPLQTKELSQLT